MVRSCVYIGLWLDFLLDNGGWCGSVTWRLVSVGFGGVKWQINGLNGWERGDVFIHVIKLVACLLGVHVTCFNWLIRRGADR